jgi:competence protein ComEC
MRRPILFIAFCFLVGLLAGHYIPIPPAVFGFGQIICLLIGYGLFRTRNITVYHTILAGLFIISSGAFWYVLRTQMISANDLRRLGDHTTPLTIYGTIIRDPDLRSRYTLVTLETDSVQIADSSLPMPFTGRMLVRLQQGIGPGAYGDHMRVTGWLRSPQPARNPGGFDAWTYYTSRGVYGLMSIRNSNDYTLVARRSSPTFYTALIRPVKNSITDSIEATLQGPSAALLKGILLGQRQQLPDELLNTFSTIGLTHILAVSGLHVGLIALITITCFSVLRVPRAAATTATIGVLILYACITNMTSSVVRASIMASLFLIGQRLERQTDAINILATAGLIILIIWPSALFDLSFQLSFIATLIIIAGYPKLKSLLPERWGRSQVWWAQWLRDGLLVSLAAQLGTAPVLTATFYQVSWVAPLANLFLGPLVFLTTTLGVLTALTNPIFFGIARLFSATNALVLQGMIYLSTQFSNIPFALLPIAAPSYLAIAGYYTITLLLLWPPLGSTWKRVRPALAGAIIILLCWQNYNSSRPLEITILDVGQGDAIFIVCPNGKKILIDGGHRTPSYDAGTRVVVPFLRSKGYHHIDTMIISHPHADHYGGLISVLDAVTVGEIVTSGRTSNSNSYKAWRKAIVQHGVRYRSVTTGDTLRGLGHVQGVILNPTRSMMEQKDRIHTNDVSVVTRLTYGTFSALFTGDIEQDAEEAMLSRHLTIKSTIIKAPHHGSETSSSLLFLRAVDPEAAVISVGQRNKFRHPSKQVLERYDQLGTAVYRTDAGGAIIIRSDGQTWQIHPFISLLPLWFSPHQFLESIHLTEFLNGSIFR